MKTVNELIEELKAVNGEFYIDVFDFDGESGIAIISDKDGMICNTIECESSSEIKLNNLIQELRNELYQLRGLNEGLLMENKRIKESIKYEGLH